MPVLAMNDPLVLHAARNLARKAAHDSAVLQASHPEVCCLCSSSQPAFPGMTRLHIECLCIEAAWRGCCGLAWHAHAHHMGYI